MLKTVLSKPLSVSSKYQITVPEHVREIMDIKARDAVIFSTVDGETILFEKVIAKEENHLKLVTFTRQLLHARIPVVLSGSNDGDINFLAKEIGSYEFEKVVFINVHPLSYVGHSPEEVITNVLNQLYPYRNNFVQNQSHLKALLIIRNNEYLQQTLGILIDDAFIKSLNASILILDENKECYNFQSLWYHVEFSETNVLNNHDELALDYSITQSLPNSNTNNIVSATVAIDFETSEAITVWSLLKYIETNLLTQEMEAFFYEQTRVYFKLLSDCLKDRSYQIHEGLQYIEQILESENNAAPMIGIKQVVKQFFDENGIKKF